MDLIQQLSPEALQQKIATTNLPLILLDVREPNERELCALPGSLFIPMAKIPLEMGTLPSDTDIVVYCHHGVRSYNVIAYLIHTGFEPENLFNLDGGIDAWALRVDPAMPRY